MTDADNIQRIQKLVLNVIERDALSFQTLTPEEKDKRVDYCFEIALGLCSRMEFIKKYPEEEREQIIATIMAAVGLGVWTGNTHYIEAEFSR